MLRNIKLLFVFLFTLLSIVSNAQCQWDRFKNATDESTDFGEAFTKAIDDGDVDLIDAWEALDKAGVRGLEKNIKNLDDIKSVNKYMKDNKLDVDQLSNSIKQADSFDDWKRLNLGKNNANDWLESLPTALKTELDNNTELKQLFDNAADATERANLEKAWSKLDEAGLVLKNNPDELEKAAKYLDDYPNASVAEVRQSILRVRGFKPADFGVKTLAEKPELLKIWNDNLKKLASSSRSNKFKRYLEKLENRTQMTNDELAETFSYVRQRFRIEAEKVGLKIEGEIHHWNYPKSNYPDQITNPSNLTEPVSREIHELIHDATSSGNNKFVDPIAPEHVIPINSTPISN